ncbi:MAG: single-stranded DNA-binding protein [Flavobacteriales bacterium]
MGNVGENPKSHSFENGNLVVRFSLANNDYYVKDGEKIQQTQWHKLVAWGKQAELAEKYITKGKEIGNEGKLTSPSYENEAAEKQYITEILVHEILLLGTSGNNQDN